MEMTVKKREWVKNAAIIFLAVMLVLTFFSNTIMNRSLPEVASQSVVSGEIVNKIRGTGAVQANESYEVTLPQSREIESVKVKPGDEVKKGDVLFTLSTAQSDEVLGAQEAVDSAQGSYQQALIEASKTSKDGAVIRAREALQDAKTDFAYCTKVSADSLASARSNAATLTANTTNLEAKYNEANTALENAGGWQPASGDGDSTSVDAALAAWTDAQSEKSAADIKYKERYTVFENIAKERQKAKPTYGLEAHKKALFEEYSAKGVEEDVADEFSGINTKGFKKGELADAYEAITDATAKEAAAHRAYTSASNAYYSANSSSTSGNYNLKQEADKAKVAYQSAKVQSDAAQASYENLKQQKTDYDAAKQAVYDKEDALSEAMANVKLSSLNLRQLATAVARAQQKLGEISKNSNENTVTAKVDGVMKTVDAVAGKSYDGTIATITLPEQGFCVSFSVTNEQARKVHTGDVGDISNYYSGDVTATLQTIKTDPQNPQGGKVLVFDITGDVTEGTNLTIAVGERSAEYDTIVPNSAIRSDANGDFVLSIVSKSSPLGNRYIATRVDVEKVASDDSNTAVSGALNPYDYVITTSSKPINNKDRVKLADA